MFPFAVISDIHGSLDELDRVLEAISEMGIERVYCLGDIIGRGGKSRECFDRVMDKCDVVLAGNHDALASGAFTGYNIPEKDQEAVTEARGIFWRDDEFAELPVAKTVYYYDTVISLVHASPIDPVWEHIGDAEDARSAFAADPAKLILFGHTHRASWADTQGAFKRVEAPHTLNFQSGVRYLLNPGAVIDKGEFMVVNENSCEWHKI